MASRRTDESTALVSRAMDAGLPPPEGPDGEFWVAAARESRNAAATPACAREAEDEAEL